MIYVESVSEGIFSRRVLNYETHNHSIFIPSNYILGRTTFNVRSVIYGRDNAWLKHWVVAFVDPE